MALVVDCPRHIRLSEGVAMPETRVIQYRLAHKIYSMELEQRSGNAYSYDVYTDRKDDPMCIVASGGFICPDGFAVCLRVSLASESTLEIVFEPLPPSPPQA